MNYVPGTASLIDDIDSKTRAEAQRLCCLHNHFCLSCPIFVGLSPREASGVAPRWQNADRVPAEH